MKLFNKKPGAFCDKCKKIVIKEEGDHIVQFINLVGSPNTLITFCPRCADEFTSWLSQKEEEG